MTKFLLVIFLCSSVAQSCLDPHTFPETYDSTYDCLLDGYVKSIDKMKEIGREEVNKHGIYLKFDCQAYVLPEKKPASPTAHASFYTN